MLRSTRGVALITLALLNVFTLAAGVVLARMLPPRLALLKPVRVADRPEVKSALGMYRNAEQNLASAQRDIDRYQSLVDKGGPGAADAKPFLDTAKNVVEYV